MGDRDLAGYLTAVVKSGGKKGRKRYKGTNTITEVQRKDYQLDTTNTRQYKGKRQQVGQIWVWHKTNARRRKGTLKLLQYDSGWKIGKNKGWAEATIVYQDNGLFRLQVTSPDGPVYSININVFTNQIKCRGNNSSDVTMATTGQMIDMKGDRLADYAITYKIINEGVKYMECLRF